MGAATALAAAAIASGAGFSAVKDVLKVVGIAVVECLQVRGVLGDGPSIRELISGYTYVHASGWDVERELLLLNVCVCGMRGTS